MKFSTEGEQKVAVVTGAAVSEPSFVTLTEVRLTHIYSVESGHG